MSTTVYKAINTAAKGHIDGKKLFDACSLLLRNKQKINSFLMGREIDTPVQNEFVSPINNTKTIYQYGSLERNTLKKALEKTEMAKNVWKSFSQKDINDMFLKAADLIEGKYFYEMMAATMVNQGKTIYEAEIDCIQELCDFLRFNVQYAEEIKSNQPISPMSNIRNTTEYLPLMGYVAAITPFNFTAIAGNLATAPLLFRNVCFWKPSNKSLLSNKLVHTILLEANFPPEVLNFCVIEPQKFILASAYNNLSCVLFTGSTFVFNQIKSIVNETKQYRTFPDIRFIGETGGKNFHFLDENVNLELAALKTVESAYNYSGQKCSACSRVYVPKTLADEFVALMQYFIDKKYNESEKYGLIDEESYSRVVKKLTTLKNDKRNNLVYGGEHSNKKGQYYLAPTLFTTNNNYSELYRNEYFAPILVMYNYDDKKVAMEHCANITDYRLTGSVFSNDVEFIEKADDYFKYNCGNFYINDKSTGAVVGQQPFGGFGNSGTNDKAGDINMLMPLFLQRNTKENRINTL